MKIIVDGKEAVLQAGSTFEYISENPLFTEAEGYSLEITFPMKDCPENILIFGALHVQGVDISKVTFPCELDAGTFRKTGILTITSVTDREVKGQFLEGKSQENLVTALPEVYINELDYSAYDGTEGGWSHDPSDWPSGIGIFEGWTQFDIYDKSSGRVLTAVESDPDGHDFLCRHIYLWKLVELIATVMPGGWSIDQSNLKAMEVYEYAIVANRRDFIRHDGGDRIRPLKLSLPHWTVKQFFSYVSDFFGFSLDIDYSAKAISFIPYKDITNSNDQVSLTVNDDFEVEIQDAEGSYRGNKKFKLPDSSDPDKLNSCAFILDDPRVPKENLTYDQMRALIAGGLDRQSPTGLSVSTLYYITDKGYHVVVTSNEEDADNPGRVIQKVQVINQCDSSEGGEELMICPCPQGAEQYRYHDWPQYYYDMPVIEIPSDPDDSYDPDAPHQSPAVIERISEGERKEEDMYFDKLWLVRRASNGVVSGFRFKYQYWWTVLYDGAGNIKYDDEGNQEVRYYTQQIFDDGKTLTPEDPAIKANVQLPQVDETQLYRYKFLGTTIPSPTSVFLINGQKFACLRITAHFTVDGMSELLEGEFYRIID